MSGPELTVGLPATPRRVFSHGHKIGVLRGSHAGLPAVMRSVSFGP